MHFRAILRFLGIIITFIGVSILIPLVISIFYEESIAFKLLISMIISTLSGLLIHQFSRKKENTHLSHRDGVAIVTFGWLGAGLVGAIPFILTGAIGDFTDALFESISGFTTTGASILTDIESLPRSILLWRSLIQWYGGMGIIVLSIAILPYLGVGGMQLYKAEIPSPFVEKLKPRISDTAKILWKVYVLITLLEVVLLVISGLPVFDAICHAFTTMPTGGFSTKNASISHYNNILAEVIIVFFMILAGINFSLHYRLLKGEKGIYFKNTECKVFLIMILCFILIITLNIYGKVYDSIIESLRYATFQVCSIITTTGYATADFDKWPSISHKILLICMFLGAMAGSTGGGLKTMRIILIAKHCYKEIFRIIHPHAVTQVKLEGKPISSDILGSIWGFVFLYLGLFVFASLVMAQLGMDIVSAFSSVSACIFNIGPGLGMVGPAKNYAQVPLIGKWVLIFCMLAGRLEIYTILILLVPEFWRK